MSKRLPVTIDQSPSVNRANNSLTTIHHPKEIGWGGPLLGWLENWQLKNTNKANEEYVRYLTHQVALAKLITELREVTDHGYVRAKIERSTIGLRDEIEELQATSARRARAEEIAIEKHLAEMDLLRHENALQSAKILRSKIPVQQKLKEVLESHQALVSDLLNSHSIDDDQKQAMIRQLEHVRDSELVANGGIALGSRKADATPQSNSANVDKKTQQILLRAECAAKCAQIQNNTDLTDHQKKAYQDALKLKCEQDCLAL